VHRAAHRLPMLTSHEGIIRLLAPNPSPVTLTGTNTYIVDCGNRKCVVVDPGPRSRAHVLRIQESIETLGLEIAAIVVTHGHADHAPAARPLARWSGAPVHGHPLARFAREVEIADQGTLTVGRRRLRFFHAPGHTPDSIVVLDETARAFFTGDVVIGAPSVLIAPPAGEMRAYVRTLVRLRSLAAGTQHVFGGHGEPLADPPAVFDRYIAHRAKREKDVLTALSTGPRTIPELVKALYPKLAPELRPVASRQILSHLLPLVAEGRLHHRSSGRKATREERRILGPELGPLGYPEEGLLDPELIGRSEASFDLQIYSDVRATVRPAKTRPTFG